MKRKEKDIKKIVKDSYAKVAKQGVSCCPPGSCCSPSNSARNISKAVGYSYEDMSVVPEGSNLGLGCGNPVAIASLKKGETVLDLGSGAGFDAFLVAARVGNSGKVIGVDMTHEMVSRAKENALKGKYENVEFRLGEIENLPVEDNLVDVVISNCVINLSPDKRKVFSEAFRVLKPGGRIMVSDLVLEKELPEAVRESIEAYVGCLAGAAKKEDYFAYIKEAGFKDIKVMGETNYPIEAMINDAAAKAVVSIKIHAVKPVH